MSIDKAASSYSWEYELIIYVEDIRKGGQAMVAQPVMKTLPPDDEMIYVSAKDWRQYQEIVEDKEEQLRYIFKTLAVSHTIMGASAKITAIVLDNEMRDKQRNARGYYQVTLTKVTEKTGLGYSTVLSARDYLRDQMGLIDTYSVPFEHAKPNGQTKRTAEFYIKPLPRFPYPAQYETSTPRNDGGSRPNHIGNRSTRCPKCNSENVDVVETIICHNCHAITHQEKQTSQEDLLVHQIDRPEESPLSSTIVDADPSPAPYQTENPEQPAAVYQFDSPEEILPSIKLIDSYTRTQVYQIDTPTSPENVDTGGVVPIGFANPPEQLRAGNRWAPYRLEPREGTDKLAKVPYQIRGRTLPRAKVDDPATWCSYDQALAKYKESLTWRTKQFDGIGFFCTGEETVIDKDNCLSAEFATASVSQAALDLMASVPGAYWEVSRSCKGLHGYALGTVGVGRKTPELEMYCSKRFMVWTGNHIVGSPLTLEPAQEQIAALYATLTPAKAALPPCVYAKPVSVVREQSFAISPTHVLEKARKAANSAKFERLWSGDCTGYASQSEADLALCKMLAYWSDKDADLMDVLFRQSGLYREKWDEPARSGEGTYGQGTILRALC